MTDPTGQMLDLVGQEAAERLHLTGKHLMGGASLIQNILSGRTSIKGGFAKLVTADPDVSEEGKDGSDKEPLLKMSAAEREQ